MAVGKNKRLPKKKGQKKKIVDPYSRKEWYDIKAPAYFQVRQVGKSPVNKSTGTVFAADALKGRCVSVCLADLQNNEDQAYRNIKLKVQEVFGRDLLTQFWGMSLTTDKLQSLIRKWQSLIEAHVDVKTTDGYYLRMFCIGFTKRRPNQQKRTCYAQSSQVRQIRAKMVEIMLREATTCDLKALVIKFIPEAIGKQIEKECASIFPLHDVYLRKVKMLKSPKVDPQKLLELHSGSAAAIVTEDVGERVARASIEGKPVSSIDAKVEKTAVVGM